jgi:phosphoglycolate phosphatase-like HAD superfamily hydrolase
MATDGQTRLVLWDIDHTLIEARGLGRDVYARVFPQVTGQALRELGVFDGRTELEIIHGTLALHGIAADEEIVDGLTAALADGFRTASEELVTRGSVLPGVHAALEALAAEPGMHQSVLTGNTAEVARIKVEAFGLGRHLDLSIGAYGDDHRDRAELVTIARERASARLGIPVDADQVVLIGDTPNDVAAALTAGAHIIAVATGNYSVADLAAAGAPSPLPTLADLPQFQRALATR